MSRRPVPRDPRPSASESAAGADERFEDERREGDALEDREEPFAGATLGTVLGGIAGGVVGGPAGAVAGGALGAAGGAAVGDGARQAAEESVSGHPRRRRRRHQRPRRRSSPTPVGAALAGAAIDATQGVPASSGPPPVDVPEASRPPGGR